jgi:hypothetical protein
MRSSVHIHGKESAQPRTRVVIHTEADHLDTRTNVNVTGAEGVTRELGDAMKTRVQIHGATNQRRREAGPYQGRDVLQTRVTIEPPNVTRPKVIAELPTKHMSPREAVKVLAAELKKARARKEQAREEITQISEALKEAADQDLAEAEQPEPAAEPEIVDTVAELVTGDADTAPEGGE